MLIPAVVQDELNTLKDENQQLLKALSNTQEVNKYLEKSNRDQGKALEAEHGPGRLNKKINE